MSAEHRKSREQTKSRIFQLTLWLSLVVVEEFNWRKFLFSICSLDFVRSAPICRHESGRLRSFLPPFFFPKTYRWYSKNNRIIWNYEYTPKNTTFMATVLNCCSSCGIPQNDIFLVWIRPCTQTKLSHHFIWMNTKFHN